MQTTTNDDPVSIINRIETIILNGESDIASTTKNKNPYIKFPHVKQKEYKLIDDTPQQFIGSFEIEIGDKVHNYVSKPSLKKKDAMNQCYYKAIIDIETEIKILTKKSNPNIRIINKSLILFININVYDIDHIIKNIIKMFDEVVGCNLLALSSKKKEDIYFEKKLFLIGDFDKIDKLKLHLLKKKYPIDFIKINKSMYNISSVISFYIGRISTSIQNINESYFIGIMTHNDIMQYLYLSHDINCVTICRNVNELFLLINSNTFTFNNTSSKLYIPQPSSKLYIPQPSSKLYIPQPFKPILRPSPMMHNMLPIVPPQYFQQLNNQQVFINKNPQIMKKSSIPFIKKH